MSAVKSRAPVPMTRQRGVTLIEALIAGIVLAIGILGVVSLLALSKVSQHETIQRTRAISLADDILERIRRNPAGIVTYQTGTTGFESPLGNGSITDEPDPDCSTATCTPAQLAAHDRWAWERLLDGASVTVTDGGTTTSTTRIRGLRGCIAFDADAGKTNTGVVSVVLQWQGLRDTADAVPTGNVCGGDAAGTDPTRRQVVLDSYLIDETEL